MSQKGRKKIRIEKKLRNEILKKANVVGVGVGEKYKNGETTHQQAMVCLVVKKVDKKSLSEDDLLPTSIIVNEETVPVDVIAVGELKALSTQHRFNHRPLVTGISCGHFAITAGTLGLFVEKNGEPYLLSNNHVIADNNQAKIGDAIYQPAPFDGGRSRHTVATLAEFVPIQFGFTARNKVDAAIAKMVGYDDPSAPVIEQPSQKARNWFLRQWDKLVALVKNSIDWFIHIFFGKKAVAHHAAHNVNVIVDGKIVEDTSTPAPQKIEFSNTVLNMPTPITGNLADAEVGDGVQKSGRTTGYTISQVLATDVTVKIDFGPNQFAMFEGQTVAGDFSLGGDSGSAIFDMQGNAVGLLFAGSDVATIFTPMKTVFKELGINRIW
jgi:hypothetical protein